MEKYLGKYETGQKKVVWFGYELFFLIFFDFPSYFQKINELAGPRGVICGAPRGAPRGAGHAGPRKQPRPAATLGGDQCQKVQHLH